MKPTCRSCEDRHKDFGGCRCQAFLLTGDPAETDPVCSKSAHHEKVVAVVKNASKNRHIPIVFRSDAESRMLHEPPRSAPAAVAAPRGGAFTASGGRAP